MSAVVFEQVAFSYDGKKQALDDVSLQIEKGSFTCILGGNGSGKSTLAKLINALLLPDSGTVHVLDHLTSNPDNLFFVRSNAGMVFQNPDDQIVASVVEDDVAFGPENIGVPEEELALRVRSALEQVGLSGFAHRETYTLSGGQKQRVAFAGMLALQPQILILDEAGAMLDPRGQKELFKVCRELNEQGLTIVFITHSMDEAARADRVIVLKNGTIALDGSPRNVLSCTDELRELNLDIPFAAEMSSLLQARGVAVPFCLTLHELVASLRAYDLSELDGNKNRSIIPVDETPRIASSDHMDISSNGTTEPVEARARPTKTQAASPLLSFEDVSFTYLSKQARKAIAQNRTTKTYDAHSQTKWGNHPGELWALQDIDLEIFPGDFLGIAGHTGSGKSTLLQLANGILQPTKGRILINGQDLSHKKAAREAHQRIGLVFQYPERQLFASTVFDDIAFGPRNMGLSEDEVAKRVREALDLMQLDENEIKDRSPFVLSGGQQRRVAIAGILAMDPEVLVLDEPAAGLDPLTHDHLLALIKDLHEHKKKTVVMVSHNMDDLAYACDRIIILNQGKIIAQGEPADIFSTPEALARIGLSIPRTLQLEHSLGINDTYATMPENAPAIPTMNELADAIAWRVNVADSDE